ncbi:MAG: hypothetical protein ACLU9S_22185 [Oscillospiraceae bacterium]
MERLICDQFGGCEIDKSDIAAAGGDGFGRLINTVQFRLDAGKLDGLEVKSAGIKLPDHPAPDILIRREEKQRSGDCSLTFDSGALRQSCQRSRLLTVAREKSKWKLTSELLSERA